MFTSSLRREPAVINKSEARSSTVFPGRAATDNRSEALLKSTGPAFGPMSIAVVADTITEPGAGFRPKAELELEPGLGPEPEPEVQKLGGSVKRRAERIPEQHRFPQGNY